MRYPRRAGARCRRRGPAARRLARPAGALPRVPCARCGRRRVLPARGDGRRAREPGREDQQLTGSLDGRPGPTRGSPSSSSPTSAGTSCCWRCPGCGRLPEQPHVVVVDNGSTDGTAEAVRDRHPGVRADRQPEPTWARSAATWASRCVDTPYVAFCDDDTWWEPGSLRTAADVLDAAPAAGRASPRGSWSSPAAREDPIVAELRDSPVLGAAWLPGPGAGQLPRRGRRGAPGGLRRRPAGSPTGCGSAARRS